MSASLGMSLDEIISAKGGGGKGGGRAMRKEKGDRRERSTPYEAPVKRGRGTFHFDGSGAQTTRRPAPTTNMASGNAPANSVRVGNLPFSVDWRELKEFMGGADAGVVRVDLATKPDGSSRGYAIVQMASAKTASSALAWNGEDLQGRSITITAAGDQSARGGNQSRRGTQSRGGASSGTGDGAEDDGYSYSGSVGRNGWVKPEVGNFVDDGPPPEPNAGRKSEHSLSR